MVLQEEENRSGKIEEDMFKFNEIQVYALRYNVTDGVIHRKKNSF